jgi:two-component system, chemotaxis family, response regulator Rcp1
VSEVDTILSSKTHPEVLLVDDNPADVDLMREILGGCKRRYHVSSVGNGEEAISFLHRRGKYADAPCPDLVILDLNLPRKDGRAVLKELKTDSLFYKIPIVVFTTSQASSDITSSYALGANCYIQKPVDFDQFRATVKNVGFYWLLINQAPVMAEAAKGGA